MDFDERSGVIDCQTPWGRWWQTLTEIHVEVTVPEGTKPKDVTCDICTKKLSISVRGTDLSIQGNLPRTIHPDDSVWTLEDRKLLRLCLAKADPSDASAWKMLLDGQYEADPVTLNSMGQKLTLEKMQMEHAGLDFSNATVSGNYQDGRLELPSK